MAGLVHTRIAITVSAALTALVLVAGAGAATGQGGAVPDAFERAVARAADSEVAPDAFERAAARASAETPTRPDDTSARRGPGAFTEAGLLRPDDRAGTRGGPGTTRTLSSSAQAAGGDFSWDAAAYGAGLTLGVMALAALFVVSLRGLRVAPR